MEKEEKRVVQENSTEEQSTETKSPRKGSCDITAVRSSGMWETL